MGGGDTYHIDVHLTVGGSVVKEQDLVRSIRDGLIRLQRNDNIRLAR